MDLMKIMQVKDELVTHIQQFDSKAYLNDKLFYRIEFIHYFPFEGLEHYKDALDNIFNFIEEEIDLRYESLICDFDKLNDKLFDQLALIEKKIFKYSKNNRIRFNNSINDTTYTINIREIVNEFKVNNKRLDASINCIKFESTTSKPLISSFGLFAGPDIIYTDIIKYSKLNIQKFPSLVLSANAILHNGSQIILSSSIKNSIVFIHNQTFQIIRKIDEINGFKLSFPSGLCLDEYNNSVYICNRDSHQILVVDKNFKILKQTIGNHGAKLGQFSKPIDIKLHSNELFVLDTGNKRIQVFTKTGRFLRHIRLYTSNTAQYDNNTNALLDYPIRLAVKDDTIAVSNNFLNIYIYNFNGQIKQVLSSNIDCVMCFAANYLFTCNNIGSLVCYEFNQDENKYVINFERRLVMCLVGLTSFMIYKNNHFYITFSNKGVLTIV